MPIFSDARISPARQGRLARDHDRAAPEQERLAFIHHSRELGFSLDDIRELLSLSDQPDMTCAAADVIATRQLVAVEDRITRRQALQQELERMLTQCAQGTVSDCKVIEVLSNH